jgi:hypothetical protein
MEMKVKDLRWIAALGAALQRVQPERGGDAAASPEHEYDRRHNSGENVRIRISRKCRSKQVEGADRFG